MTIPNLPDLIAQLQLRLDSLGDIHDCTSDNAKAELWSTKTSIQRSISALRNPPNPDLDSRIHDWQARKDEWEKREADLVEQIRHADEVQQQTLKATLKRLRDGVLIVSPGQTIGTLGAIDDCLGRLVDRKSREQDAFDAALKHAEALLGQPVSS